MSAWEWPNTKLIRVVDGDTIDVLLTRDLGFGGTVTFPVRLRLNRINAPKDRTARGMRSHARVVEAIGDQLISVTTIKPYKYGGPADDLGEYMAEIHLPNGTNVSDLLVTEELAVYWNGKGPRPEDHG